MGIFSSAFKETFVPVMKGAKATVQTLLALQALAVGSIVAVDELRKLREVPHADGYPQVANHPEIKIDKSYLKTYTDGDTLYVDMLEAINQAKKTIYFETFIWKDDSVGRQFKEALIKAARRGVEVYLVWDVFGNLVVPFRFFRFPKLKNLHTLGYPLTHTARDHRKILVVDSQIGFVGGYNIGDTYTTNMWRDTHVRIVGPGVWELEDAFVTFWNYAQRWRIRLRSLPPRGAKAWNNPIQVLVNDPKRLLFPVRGLYINALNKAEDSVYITSAYFMPDKVIQKALIEAARRGVKVKVLVPEKSNHIIADWVSQAYLRDLLKNGVELWLYKDVMIHAKTAVVDGRWCTIGTANIDRLSMTGNFEINLSVANRKLAKHMEVIFQADLTNSKQITWEEWQQRSLFVRLIEGILGPLGWIL